MTDETLRRIEHRINDMQRELHDIVLRLTTLELAIANLRIEVLKSTETDNGSTRSN